MARLAAATTLTSVLAGPFAAASLAATTDPVPLSAAGLPLIAIGAGVSLGVAFLISAARRRRTAGEGAQSPEPAGLDPRIDDFDRLLAAARAGPARRYDGRGSLSTDRVGDVSDEPVADIGVPGSGPIEMTADRDTGGSTNVAPAAPAAAPVWVRRLDGRIPVLPTIQTLPVDHDVEGHRRLPPSPLRRGR